MNSMTKSFFSVFSVVCVAVLAIFLILLIVLNTGGENEGSEPAVSEGTGGQSISSGSNDTPGVSDDSEGESSEPSPIPTPRPPPQGTRYTFPIDENERLIVYAQDDIFNFVEDINDWRFEHKGSSAALSISFLFLSPQSGGGSDAEAFLNEVIGSDTAEFKGTYSIVDSEMSGFYAQAIEDGTTYEVWLYRLTNSEQPLALVFLVNFDFGEQRDAIYDVLSSMSLEQA